MAYVITRACTKCGACLPECPMGAIIEGPDHFLIDADTCADHTVCVSVCPVNAIILLEIPSSEKITDFDEEL